MVNLNLMAAGSSSPTRALAGAPLGALLELDPDPPGVHIVHNGDEGIAFLVPIIKN